MTSIAIIIGSTRPGRKSAAVAQWVHQIAGQRDDATYQLVDLADHDLPHLDEPVAAAMSSDYVHEHSRVWSATIAAFDGFVFVTPEYNHSTTGVLKNAIDYLYPEWHNKAAGIVSYGLNGGTRAAEHLRLVLGELQVADVRGQVALGMFTDFDGGEVRPAAHQADVLNTLLDQVVAWSEALRTLRPARQPA